MDYFYVSEILVGKVGWRFGYGCFFKDYFDWFVLLYDYVFYYWFVWEEQGLLKLIVVGEEKLGVENIVEMIQLFWFWLRFYKGVILNLFFIVYWIGECVFGWFIVEFLF